MDIAKSTRKGLAEVNKPRVWLAEKLSVSPGYISDVCNGKQRPNLDRIQLMSQIFGVRVSVFISWGE